MWGFFHGRELVLVLGLDDEVGDSPRFAFQSVARVLLGAQIEITIRQEAPVFNPNASLWINP